MNELIYNTTSDLLILNPTFLSVERVLMFHFDSMLLQIFIILSLLSISYASETFYIVVYSIVFLTLTSAVLWLNNLDVFVNFLLIIDLGLFFAMLGFIINLVNMFSPSPRLRSFSTPLVVMILVTVIGIYCILNLDFRSLDAASHVAPHFNFNLSLYDWFSIYNLTFFSDLQLLAEVYFKFNFVEFIIMNLVLYLGVFLVYVLLNYKTTTLRAHKTISTRQSGYSSIPQTFDIFMKTQSFQKQINQSMTVRVWGIKAPNRQNA